MDKRILSTLLLAGTSLTMLPAADCNPGNSSPPPAVLRIKDLTVSKSKAHVGDSITITWDVDDPADDKHTTITFLSPVLGGIDNQHTVSNDPSTRSVCFKFEGPVTVEIAVDDGMGHSDRVAFDVRLDDGYFFEADVTGMRKYLGDSGFAWAPETQYPNLHYPAGSNSKHLVFSNFAGIYDNPPPAAENGVIDALVSPLAPAGLPFRADSTSGKEPGFGMEQGSSYPSLQPAFLETPIGQQFLGTSRSDSVVFGGAVAYDGEVVDVKSGNEGAIAGYRGSTSYEAIFLELVYRTDAAGHAFLADALLGNLNQGLVLSIMEPTDISLETGCFVGGQGSLDACPSQTATYGSDASGQLVVSGSLDAQLGWSVQTADGDLFWPHVHVSKLTYRMPFYEDNDPALVGRVHGVAIGDQQVCSAT